MQKKAQEIDDAALLIDRVLYRDARLLDGVNEQGLNFEAQVRIMTGFNKADLNRLRELLQVE